MPSFVYDAGPDPAVQQLADLPGSLAVGRLVRLSDEDYTVAREDSRVILSKSVAGTNTLTFGQGYDGQVVKVLMPAAPGAGDYTTAGLETAPGTLDAAGENFEVMYDAERDEWHTLVDGVT